MVDANGENANADAPFEELIGRMMGHRAFADERVIGGRLEAFVDAQAERRLGLWRPGYGSYALGARELAVELGLRYLPLAAEDEFLDVADYADRDLYPPYWQAWLNADLLRLYEDEEEALAEAVWSRARRPAQAAVGRPAAAARRAPSPVARQAHRIAALTRRVERLAEGLGVSAERVARGRVMQMTPRRVSELVQVRAAEATGRPSSERAIALPALLTTARVADSATIRPIVAGRSAPAIQRTEREAARTARRLTSQARSPYPAGMGRTATFATLIAARPEASVRRLPGAQALIGAGVRPSPRDVVGPGDRPPQAPTAVVPSHRPAVWLDDIGLDSTGLPALTASLVSVAQRAGRLARSAELGLGPGSSRLALLSALEERVSGRRMAATPPDVQQAQQGEPWRAALAARTERAIRLGPLSDIRTLVAIEGLSGRLEAGIGRPGPALRPAPPTAPGAPMAPGAPTTPLRRAEAVTPRTAVAEQTRQLAQRLLARADSVRLAGLTGFDPDPGAPGSDTQLALRVDRAARQRREPGVRMALAELAPGRPLDLDGARPVAADQAPARSRTWQLFSPAKALSLALMLSESEPQPLAERSGTLSFGSAVRLSVALGEGRRALADWEAESGMPAGRVDLSTAFGPVALERHAGGVRTMRSALSERGALVQLYAQAPSSLAQLALAEGRRLASRLETGRPPTTAVGRRVGAGPALEPRTAARVATGTGPAVAAPRWQVSQPMVARAMDPFARAQAPSGRFVAQPERVIAASSSGGPGLPISMRSPLDLLTSIPATRRQAVGDDLAVALPSGVTLPAAAMRALRTAPRAGAQTPRLSVLALLESPTDWLSPPSQRASRAPAGPPRVLLMTVGGRPPEGLIETGRPLAPLRAVSLPTPPGQPVIERRALRLGEPAPPTALTAGAERGIVPAEPALVARLVAEGRLHPMAPEATGRFQAAERAVSRPELGSFVPDASLAGWTRFDPTLLALGESAGLPRRLAAMARLESHARPAAGPSLLARRAAAPELVTLSDEVAQAAPLTTDIARAGLRPMARLELAVPGGGPAWRPVSMSGAPPAILAEGLAPAGARSRWASGLVRRTEGFTERALAQLEGRARLAQAPTWPALAGRPELIGLAVEAAETGRLEPSVTTLRQRQREGERVLAQALSRADRSSRPVRLPRIAVETPVVGLVAARDEFRGVSEPSLGPSMTGPRRRPEPGIAREQAVGTLPSAPRRVQPAVGARVRRGGEQVGRRPLAAVQQEARAELRRAGMTPRALAQLADWTPPTVRPVSSLGAEPSALAVAPTVTRALVDLTRRGVAAGAEGIARVAAVSGTVRSAIRALIGARPERGTSGIEVGEAAELPSVARLASALGAPRRGAYGLQVSTDLVRPAQPRAAQPRVGAAVRPAVSSAGPPSGARAPSPERAAVGQTPQPWGRLLGLAGLVYTGLSGPEEGAPAGSGFGRSRLRRFERELATLLERSRGAEVAVGAGRGVQARAAQAARSLLTYLEAEPEEPKPVRRPPPHRAGPPGEVVTHEAKPVRPARTRLSPKRVETRAPRTDQAIQGEPTAGPREYVAPWMPPRPPDISIQPLAQRGRGGGTTSEGRSGAEGDEEPPGEKLEVMAEQVYELIRDWVDLEHKRMGVG